MNENINRCIDGMWDRCICNGPHQTCGPCETAKAAWAELSSIEGSNARFTIGTKFRTRGKHPKVCTIVDIHRTFNSKNELVKLRYVATHEVMGQTVTDYDVVDTTVAMGLITE